MVTVERAARRRRIRTLVGAGQSYRAIADELGVSPSTVHYAVRRAMPPPSDEELVILRKMSVVWLRTMKDQDRLARLVRQLEAVRDEQRTRELDRLLGLP